MAKKFTRNKNGKYGTLICFAYHDETFEGFPVDAIWVPLRFAKPENIKIGQIYDMKLHDGYAVKLKPIIFGNEVY